MKTVLIVDDSTYMRAKIREVIEDEGYKVVAEANDGKEAVEFYKEHQPDVVLLDIIMPKVDGIIALRELMEIDPHAQVLVFSSLSTKYNIQEAVRLGAKDFIIKPNFEELLPALSKL